MTNGPDAAQAYRERNPQVAPAKPTRPLSNKTLAEMAAGSLMRYAVSMPGPQYTKLVRWKQEWWREMTGMER